MRQGNKTMLEGLNQIGDNGGVYMLVDNSLQRKLRGDLLFENREKALEIINRELEMGYPVMVGLSYNGGTLGELSNRNKLVGHFVNIVGRGLDQNGNYYIYWDNAYFGTNTQINRFYLKSNNTLINPSVKSFIVVDVRNNIRRW